LAILVSGTPAADGAEGNLAPHPDGRKFRKEDFTRKWGNQKILKVVIIMLLLVAAGCAAYYYGVFRPLHVVDREFAYVRPETVTLQDSRAEVHFPVATVKAGDRIEILTREGDWARVRLATGQTGWLDSKDLVDTATYEAGKHLREELERSPPQAEGRTTFEANLRLEPFRDAPVLTRLPQSQSVEIYGRRLVPRSAETIEGAGQGETRVNAEQPPTMSREAWYLVRADSHGGWLLGRLVTLKVPEAVAAYAQNVNMVAWLVLNTVNGDGRRVPQYLVADRIGTQETDFNHIRVFTWWAKEQHYVTAYVESNLHGYFPIRVIQMSNVPYFRLRLVDKGGKKIQKVYTLDQTVVRPLGIVEGWASEGMPTRPLGEKRRRR